MGNFEHLFICRRAKISRWCVQMEKFGEVLWCSAFDYSEAYDCGNFVLYSHSDRQPV